MARSARDNLHSRLVGFLKIVLPLIALMILSTLFLFPRPIDLEDAIPYADVDVAERVREPRMTLPGYAGMTDDGSELVLTADEARPGQGETGPSAYGLAGTLTLPDGQSVSLTAKTALMRQEDRRIVLEGGIVLSTSDGYSIRTAGIIANLDRTGLESTAPVEAEGPPGTLTAGSMKISETTPGSGQYVLVFNSGVRLIYLPAR